MLKPNELYTIQRILEEYEIPVCIQKANWSGDFYFRIERIEDGMAKGTAFKHGKPYNRLFGEYKYYLNEIARIYGNNRPQKYNSDGFDKDGYNSAGYDRYGYNRYGYNKDGFDLEGYDKNGFNSEGYDRRGFNVYGFDKNGYNRAGFDVRGYNKLGYDHEGYDIKGYNKSGYDRKGFNVDGYDKDGFDKSGYNELGFNRSGYNSKGFDKNGYNRAGYDINKFNKNGYNCDGYNQDGYDKNGYDHQGYNKEGYNKFGINAEGKPDAELRKKYIPEETIIYHDIYGKGVFKRFSTSQNRVLIHVDFDKKQDATFVFPDSLGQYIYLEKPERKNINLDKVKPQVMYEFFSVPEIMNDSYCNIITRKKYSTKWIRILVINYLALIKRKIRIIFKNDNFVIDDVDLFNEYFLSYSSNNLNDDDISELSLLLDDIFDISVNELSNHTLLINDSIYSILKVHSCEIKLNSKSFTPIVAKDEEEFREITVFGVFSLINTLLDYDERNSLAFDLLNESSNRSHYYLNNLLMKSVPAKNLAKSKSKTQESEEKERT